MANVLLRKVKEVLSPYNCLKCKYRNEQETCGEWLQLLKHFRAKQMLFFAFHTSFFQIKGINIFLDTKKATNTSYTWESAPLSILVSVHFYFFLHTTSFLTSPSQKPPMFSLLFHHLLGELQQMKPYKHTHASTRADFDSWIRWTLMCDQPLRPRFSQRFSWKTTWINKTS